MEPSTLHIPKEDEDEIRRRLVAVEREHDVRILFAIESGSRAWGFPSPDSDYDVRFVYAHKPDWYLSLDERRDVIELPIDMPFDIGGWDLKKALQLLIRPNAVLIEWLKSPIRYRWNESECEALLGLAVATQYQVPAKYHYLHLGQNQWRRFIEGKERVSLKKYFYVLRPTLALRWLRMNQEASPPMNFAELRAGTNLPADVNAFLDDLILRKAKTRELGESERIECLDTLISAEITLAEQSKNGPKPNNLMEEANVLFRKILKGN